MHQCWQYLTSTTTTCHINEAAEDSQITWKVLKCHPSNFYLNFILEEDTLFAMDTRKSAAKSLSVNPEALAVGWHQWNQFLDNVCFFWPGQYLWQFLLDGFAACNRDALCKIPKVVYLAHGIHIRFNSHLSFIWCHILYTYELAQNVFILISCTSHSSLLTSTHHHFIESPIIVLTRAVINPQSQFGDISQEFVPRTRMQ